MFFELHRTLIYSYVQVKQLFIMSISEEILQHRYMPEKMDFIVHAKFKKKNFF